MLRRIVRGIANLFRHRKVEQELDDEIGAYQDMLVQEHLAAGLSLELARRKARLAVGSADDTKEAVRDARAGIGVEQLLRDIRYGVRALSRFNPCTIIGWVVMSR